MQARKKPDNPISETQSNETTTNKTRHPLVFISHDTRDAELAEEFSNLLKSASAGALKSFRSSDKKGTQGIEYGQEWYPAIMGKIDEASDVVCLLTQHSIDRPWILYEAGVAKGKLDKKVIGIALGIPFSAAITGPFALFQNNDGDSESITKLVLELIRKVPGLDPDQGVVQQQVDQFVKKVTEITEKFSKESSIEKQDSIDENSVAKLFEEVKIMFDNLPMRIESRIEPEYGKRKRRSYPMMLDKIMRISNEFEDPYISFLIMLGFYKDDFPWFYEIGMDTYRGLKMAKTASEKEKLVRSLGNVTDLLGNPMMAELYGDNKDFYFLFKEARHMVHRLLDRLFTDKNLKE